MHKRYRSSEIFDTLLEDNDVTMYKVSKDTGVPQATLSEWRTGSHEPRTDTLVKVADYFGVTLDYLIKGETNGKDSN